MLSVSVWEIACQFAVSKKGAQFGSLVDCLKVVELLLTLDGVPDYPVADQISAGAGAS